MNKFSSQEPANEGHRVKNVLVNHALKPVRRIGKTLTLHRDPKSSLIKAHLQVKTDYISCQNHFPHGVLDVS